VIKRRGCIEWSAILICVLVVLALVALGAYAVLRIRQQQLQAQFEPPKVTVTYPASGTSTLAGSYLPVSATAFGATPIARVELWVDGRLMDTQESRVPKGSSPFYASFDLTVSQGLHSLVARAVDATGTMGDSWPVNVGGVERPGPDEPALLVTVEEGQTLDEVAAEYDVDPETVRELNPGLGDQQPPAGSEVVLPPPHSEGEVGTEGQPVGPTLPAGEVEPPAESPLPPPTGAPLAVVMPAARISWGPLLDLVTAGSPPAAPTDLQAEVAGCNVRLQWKDNADNEERYVVKYVWAFSHDARVIAELEPAAGGQAYFEFPAPSEGAFMFWVEAVNFWGEQPSNIVGPVLVEGACPQTLATHLEVEALDMALPGQYEDVYCYLSFEGAPHARVPDGGFFDDFVESVTGGQGSIGPWASGERKMVVPVPGDESLEVEGECWGWTGGVLSELGRCSGIYPRQTWDGTRLLLEGGDFAIGVAIKLLAGALDTSGQMTTFSYDDPSMRVPYDVFEDRVRSFNPVDPLTRSISWKWDGDPNTISGFEILLNGTPYNVSGGLSLVQPIARGATVMLPRECGGHISWQVRAVAGQAQSTLSALTPDNDYDLPRCPAYAMVTFQGIQFEEDCDFYPAWFLSVNGQVKEFNASCDTGAFTGCLIRGLNLRGNCGPHYFADWGEGMDPYPDTIVVPISLEQMDVEIKAAVWDRASGEMRAAVYQPWTFTSLEDLRQTMGCGQQIDYPAYGAWLWFDLYVFPTPEGLDCPVTQPVYLP
jgi:LysM repeat protein